MLPPLNTSSVLLFLPPYTPQAHTKHLTCLPLYLPLPLQNTSPVLLFLPLYLLLHLGHSLFLPFSRPLLAAFLQCLLILLPHTANISHLPVIFLYLILFNHYQNLPFLNSNKKNSDKNLFETISLFFYNL